MIELQAFHYNFQSPKSSGQNIMNFKSMKNHPIETILCLFSSFGVSHQFFSIMIIEWLDSMVLRSNKHLLVEASFCLLLSFLESHYSFALSC